MTSSPHSRLRAAVMGTPAEAELDRLEEQYQALLMALDELSPETCARMADEGFSFASLWRANERSDT